MDHPHILHSDRSALMLDRLTPNRARLARSRSGLSLRILVIVVVITTIGLLVSSLLLLGSLREQFFEQIQSSTTRLNSVLEAGLEHAMLTRDSAMLNSMVQQAATDLSAEKIRILDMNNFVRSSSWPNEVGLHIDWDTPQCRACHQAGADQTVTEQMVVHPDSTGTDALLIVSPIENQPKCNGCHSPTIQTLGVLTTRVPLTDLDHQMQEGLGRIALASLVTFGLLVGLMVPTLRSFITKPIGELSKGVAEIGAENLDYRVPVKTRDELGQLAAGFNAMQSRLRASHDTMMLRSQELALLYEVALVTGQLSDLEQILNHTLDTVIAHLTLEFGITYLWNSTTSRFEMVANRGFSPQQLQLIDQKRRKPGGDLTFDVARTGQVFFVPDITQDHHFVGTFANPIGRSYVNVPLKAQGKIVGTLELISRSGQPLSDRQMEILKAVGNQIGIAIDNTSLLSATQRGEREALTLYQLGTKVSSSLDLDVVLEAVAKGAQAALAGDVGLIGLLDADQEEVVIKSIVGTTTAEWRGLRIPVKELKAFTFVRPVLLDERPIDLAEAFVRLWNAEHITSMLDVPLLRGEHPHGIIAVLSRTRRVFSEEEVRLLTRLAQQVVVAIENARLYQQVRYMAVLEERDRLAREMHDNLAQTLGYLNLKASITGDQVAHGQAEQAQASLVEMKQIVHEAYTDTREAIFNLRNTITSGADLIPMLREYLAEYHTHYGLPAELIIEAAAPVEFSTDVAVQISRIIQEGLTNIRKHAQATRAWVRFDRELEQIRIVVEDNGRGFELNTTSPDGEEHFGLQIMRERAESVGGSVEWEPQIGRGTRVVIRVPIQSSK